MEIEHIGSTVKSNKQLDESVDCNQVMKRLAHFSAQPLKLLDKRCTVRFTTFFRSRRTDNS